LDFKIDENLPSEMAQLLIDAGHLAFTILHQGLGGASDQVVSKTALAEGKVLVTLDGGFADIRTYPPAEFPGLIVLRLQRHDKPHVLDVFQRAMSLLDQEALRGKLWIIEESRIRVRA
jgi:predicted nuclease of predicted toxin-antitoxin system